ncbi:hybrid sensor histidine kinase/response regulator [Lampropedia puyangensis]|uniref:histidine kinase n=1 Tax=Lampropedia puyangensis TaxID=1330072 RepID=A0A4S8EXS3_9BURK|nr:PAS domain-containing hybrid sensor histidine kinase/response regulator [Lampropedia puyangensis]THT99348.1 hybrid sensor histidine kinase/response regulator [Lampropedia puyangensis]
MSPIGVILVSLLYAVMLFTVAWLGDRYAHFMQRDSVRPIIYSLALAVYCSSWTFYGAVGTAARYGLGYLPIYLGPLLMFLLGWRMLERLASIARSQNTVSIADFLGSRFGRSQRLAALVTLIALVAAVPYLALQYKAVVSSLGILAGVDINRDTWGDPAFYVAAIMALFAILFGTRQVNATEHRPGLMLAVALESIVKLIALVAVGIFAYLWLSQRTTPTTAPQAIAHLIENTAPVGFVAQTLLAFAAIICLPRQFHVAVVECGDVRDIRRARWLFGTYLVIICAMVLPIAAAGLAQFGQQSAVAPDSYVLALPLALNYNTLALLAYIGGFSAATGMVIVVSVALSNMVSNDLVMPLLLRWRWNRAPAANAASQTAIEHTAALVLWVRRTVIVLLGLLAYSYSRGVSDQVQLASFGLMAFAAVAQFAPALIAGLYWQAASRKGVEAGVLAGFAVWAYTLMLPNLAEVGWIRADWIAHGPWDMAWLRPYQLFGSVGWDSLTHGTFWSLAANITALVFVSLRWRPGLSEQMQAQPFLAPITRDSSLNERLPRLNRLRIQDLQMVASHIVGHDTATRAFNQHAHKLGQSLHAEMPADRKWVHFTELLLVGAVGAASARLVMTRALQGSGMELAAVVSVLDEAGQELRFNRDILLATLENIDPGVSVIDAEMRMVAWNQRYQQLFHYPAGMLYVGRDVASLIRHNLQHNPLGLPSAPLSPERIDAEVEKRITIMRAGRSYTYVRELLDGRVIEMRGHPLPHGGYVTSYSDISELKQAERELRNINETLEQRVAERSHEVAAAQESRSRYLTAISHDVLQPIHAARLFATALQDETRPQQLQYLAERVDSALNAAEDLLDGILDLSRLDAGALQPNIQTFDIRPILEELHAQYAPIAAKRQLQWRLAAPRYAPALWVRSDPRLLRRVLQNFVANALRYTQTGGVLIAARQRKGQIVVQIWDTGPGIPEIHLARIYEEFHRYQQVFDWDGRGLGLGLSICQRIARLLGHSLQAHSAIGKGSRFAVSVQASEDRAVIRARTTPHDRCPSSPPAILAPNSTPVGSYAQPVANPLNAMAVLCLDNDPDILQGMNVLLTRWNISCVTTTQVDEALEHAQHMPRLDCLLVDYHLQDRMDGLQALAALHELRPHTPAALVTADGSDALKKMAAAQTVTVLTKPIKPAALRAFLMAAAARSSPKDEAGQKLTEHPSDGP